jgi:hypothetical protein
LLNFVAPFLFVTKIAMAEELLDPLVDKRAELAYLMTLRDQAQFLQQKLQNLNALLAQINEVNQGTSSSPL